MSYWNTILTDDLLLEKIYATLMSVLMARAIVLSITRKSIDPIMRVGLLHFCFLICYLTGQELGKRI